jgi:hypothetical protein
MQIELHPAVSLLEDTFNVLIAPGEMLVMPSTATSIATLQDPLHLRQLLPHPHSAGSQFHLQRG